MVAHWKQGFDVVYGTREFRRGESAFKLQTASLFYRLINRISEVPIPLDTGDFRLMDRRVVEVLRTMPERDRFVRGMVSWVGFRQTSVPYVRVPRAAGETKYSLRKMLALALDGIISFSNVPLRLFTLLGVLSAAAGLFGGVAAMAISPESIAGCKAGSMCCPSCSSSAACSWSRSASSANTWAECMTKPSGASAVCCAGDARLWADAARRRLPDGAAAGLSSALFFSQYSVTLR